MPGQVPEAVIVLHNFMSSRHPNKDWSTVWSCGSHKALLCSAKSREGDLLQHAYDGKSGRPHWTEMVDGWSKRPESSCPEIEEAPVEYVPHPTCVECEERPPLERLIRHFRPLFAPRKILTKFDGEIAYVIPKVRGNTSQVLTGFLVAAAASNAGQCDQIQLLVLTQSHKVCVVVRILPLEYNDFRRRHKVNCFRVSESTTFYHAFDAYKCTFPNMPITFEFRDNKVCCILFDNMNETGLMHYNKHLLCKLKNPSGDSYVNALRDVAAVLI